MHDASLEQGLEAKSHEAWAFLGVDNDPTSVRNPQPAPACNARTTTTPAQARTVCRDHAERICAKALAEGQVVVGNPNLSPASVHEGSKHLSRERPTRKRSTKRKLDLSDDDDDTPEGSPYAPDSGNGGGDSDDDTDENSEDDEKPIVQLSAESARRLGLRSPGCTDCLAMQV